MAFKLMDLIRRSLKDQAEKKMPRIRYIDGQPYAFCHVRKEWRRVVFTAK